MPVKVTLITTSVKILDKKRSGHGLRAGCVLSVILPTYLMPYCEIEFQNEAQITPFYF